MIIKSFIATFLITLGLGQLIAARWRWRTMSLVGPNRWAGSVAGIGLLLAGALLLPDTAYAFFWTPFAALLTIGLLLWMGSVVLPVPHPERLFRPGHLARHNCRRVMIPNGSERIPALLLKPPKSKQTGGAVCLVHGYGNSKTAFNWRMVRALLARGLAVLTIDLPGHGERRRHPLRYPEVLTTLPASLRFLLAQPDVRHVGVIGFSLGGAIAISSLARHPALQSIPLVVLGTPIQFQYSDELYYRELWATFALAPITSVLEEATAKQLWERWNSGGYHGEHSPEELFDLLNPAAHIDRLTGPILLVYGQYDPIAPVWHGEALRQAAPQATLVTVDKTSHMALVVLPDVSRRVAGWLSRRIDQPDRYALTSLRPRY